MEGKREDGGGRGRVGKCKTRRKGEGRDEAESLDFKRVRFKDGDGMKEYRIF